MSDLSPAPTGQSAQHSPGQTTRSTGRQAPTNEQQDARLYAPGDADPTALTSGDLICDAICPDDEFGFVCTWPKGHAHPQHIAGDSETVCAVWPAHPLAAVSAAAPDERDEFDRQWAQARAWREHVASKRSHRQARRSSFDAGWEAALAARPAPVVSGEDVERDAWLADLAARGFIGDKEATRAAAERLGIDAPRAPDSLARALADAAGWDWEPEPHTPSPAEAMRPVADAAIAWFAAQQGPHADGWLTDHLRHIKADAEALPKRLRPRLTGTRAAYNERIGSDPTVADAPAADDEGGRER